jgi:demethylmenaquinone methyltransferase/2-methoxy-6-polyprenyl-1,4-benzoquinol methylase
MSQTDFGYQRVDEAEKAGRVAGVFSAVAGNYDLMNDLMSGGLHRLWKAFTVTLAGVREGERVLDVAAGSGDLALEFAKRAGRSGEVWITDINRAMLERGRDRLLDRGLPLPAVQCDAEALPFPSDYFDCVSVAFGLRNMTDKEAALAEMRRVLKPAGRLLVLEFSRVWAPLSKIYDWYSFTVLPGWENGRGDETAYRYLAESDTRAPTRRA